MTESNIHAQHLYDSLNKNIGKTSADEFAERFPLSKSAAFDRKFKWAENVCEFLESRYDGQTIKAIRMDCTCGPSQGQMDKVKRLYDAAGSLEKFAESYNKEYESSGIRAEGDILYFSYSACYCPCVKRIDRPISRTWCYCTLGYTKRMFDYVFGCDTDVELLESVKSGGSRCVMAIRKV